MWNRYLELEQKCSQYLRVHSIFLLRLSIAIIYIWFGLLKVAGDMPPSLDLMIVHATGWMKLPYFTILLGIWETLIGVLLLINRWQRWALRLLFLQIIGTFLPLFTNPHAYFFPFPFGLTLEAQYILKNIVYIAAGLTLFGALSERASTK